VTAPATLDKQAGRPPLWRDVRVLSWTFQLAVVGLVVLLVSWLWGNVQSNSDRLNIDTGFDFLDQPAGFPIPGSDFRNNQPISDAVVEGLLNTIRLAAAGLVLATLLGVLLGIARLSGNFLVRTGAKFYVEFVRNIPLLSLLYLIYLAVILTVFPRPVDSWTLEGLAVLNVRGSNVAWFDGSALALIGIVVLGMAAAWGVGRWRTTVAERTGQPARTALFALPVMALIVAAGWLIGGYTLNRPELDGNRVSGGIEMTPAYLGALLALVLYTSSHIAEIVRGSIQAVPIGQGEAANALALSGFQRTWHVILPQAMRIAIPPIGNQYLNLMKNSSLAAIISYGDLTKVTELGVANRSPAVPAYALTLLIYLGVSLVISLAVNIFNRRLALVER